MVGQVILANPIRRGRRARPRRSYRRRRPMTALQRMYFGKRRSSRPRRTVTRSFRRNPVVSAPASYTPVQRRRRARSFYRRRVIRHYRRARGSMVGDFIVSQMLPAAVGAGGALALDMAWPYLPLPAALQSGMLAPFVRIGGAVAIGMLAGMVGGARFGREATNGALTVTFYDLAKGWLSTALPPPASSAAKPLSYYSPARGAGMGVYTLNGLDGVGVYAN